MLQAVLQGWSWDLAGKIGTSFIIPTGCPCPVVLLSFQNSPTKLAKIHYQTAVAPACNTTTSQHHFTPSYHAGLTYRSVLLPPLSLHHGLTMGEGRKSVTNWFSCLFPPSVIMLLSTGSCNCHLLMTADISKHGGVTAVTTWSSCLRSSGDPQAPWVFRERQILIFPKSQDSQGAAGWPKPCLTEVHLCTCWSYGFL